MFWYLWSIPQADPEGCCIACSPKSGSLQLSFSNTIILNIFMIPFIKPLWTSNYQLSEMLLKKSFFFLHFIQPWPSFSSIWRFLSPCPAPFFFVVVEGYTHPALPLPHRVAGLLKPPRNPGPTFAPNHRAFASHNSLFRRWFNICPSLFPALTIIARQLAPQTFWLQQLRICPFSSPDMDTLHCSR